MHMNRRITLRVMTMMLIALLSLLPMATAFAATPAQEANPDFVGLWISEESEEGETVSLSFFDDGSVQGLSEFTDGAETILYGGSWGDNGDDTLSVFIEEVDGLSIGDEPVEVLFEIVADDELNAPETTDFGDDGMSMFFEDSEPFAFADEMGSVADDTSADEATDETTDDVADDAESAEIIDEVMLGTYVSNDLTADDLPVAALVYINADGTYQSVVAAFDGESEPITQLGEWVLDADGTVILTSLQEMVIGEDGAEMVDLDDPQDLEFVLNGHVLEGEVITLFHLAAVEEQMGGFAAMVEEDMGDDDSAADDSAADFDMMLYMSPMQEILAGTINVLVLVSDGTVSFTAAATSDAEPVVEVGTWEEDSNGAIIVDLTMTEAGDDLDEPSTIVFEIDEEGNLVATDFDTERYGDSIVLELTDGE
jgi:uncharacterized lipoprotein NlpE involved in copper resistance